MKRREFLQGAATAAAVAAVPVAAVAKAQLPRSTVSSVMVFDRELSEAEVRHVFQTVLHQTAHGSQWNRAPAIGVPVEVPYHYIAHLSGRIERLA